MVVRLIGYADAGAKLYEVLDCASAAYAGDPLYDIPTCRIEVVPAARMFNHGVTPILAMLGLVSAGGVHASMDHLRALIELAAAEGVPDTIVHAFTDGRDTNPDSGAGYVAVDPRVIPLGTEVYEALGAAAALFDIGRAIDVDGEQHEDARQHLAPHDLSRSEAGDREAM